MASPFLVSSLKPKERRLGRHCFSMDWEQWNSISGKIVVQVMRTVMRLQQNCHIKAVVTKFDVK